MCIESRIKEFAKNKYGSLHQLSLAMKQLTGKNYDLTKYARAEAMPNAHLLVILNKLGCNINWLLTGKIYKHGEYPSNHSDNYIVELEKEIEKQKIINDNYAKILSEMLTNFVSNYNSDVEKMKNDIEKIKEYLPK